MGDGEQVLQQMQADEERKNATIKLLEKAKRLKDKQVKQAHQCAERATETLADAVRQSTHLNQLVRMSTLKLGVMLHVLVARSLLFAWLGCATGPP